MDTRTERSMLSRYRDIPATLCDRQSGCYVEEYFHEALSLERKRTERTGRPFTLLLADISGVTPETEWRQTARSVVKVLSQATRSTDIKGWYLYSSVLGVILTECSGIDEELIRRKTYAGLGEQLSAAQAQQVELAFYSFPDGALAQATEVDLTLYPDLSRREREVTATQVAKRLMDIAGSLSGIILFSPLFIVMPLLIKLTSKGPVLFRQERVGQYGRTFSFLKFRSMKVNNDDTIHRKFVTDLIEGKTDQNAASCGCDGKKVFKITDDPRVTPIGRFLRKSSLDELPQFFNVLMGQMSLVGPRPPIPYEVEKYDVWHRRRIMELKPGITGLWQVYGRSRTNFDEMVRLDLQYARTWSLWLDIRLLVLTPFAMLKGKGAY